jgi:hypothetical protein
MLLHNILKAHVNITLSWHTEYMYIFFKPQRIQQNGTSKEPQEIITG